MPTIPYDFEKLDDGYLSHLNIEDNNGITTVQWKYVDLRICHEGEGYYPSIESILKNTPSFRDHLMYGFTLGNYSEFFIYEDWGSHTKNVTFYLGDIEVSVGEATPLAQYIYDGHEIKHFHPPTSELRSIRVLGCDSDSAESVLLYSIIKLTKVFGFIFKCFTFYAEDLDFDDDEDEDDSDEDNTIHTVERFKNSILDLEPLRLYYKGITETETASAFIQFYRVLEYYSIFTYHTEISNLRWDTNITTREFITKMNQIVTKDERSLMSKLISRVVDTAIIKEAHKEKLIAESSISGFANGFYDFRNSLVHAKQDQKFNMYTESLFKREKPVVVWRRICEELAIRSIETFGTRSG